MEPIQQDIALQQGATYQSSLQWCSPDAMFRGITNVAIGLPTVVTAPNHGLTNPTPVWITNVRGPDKLNTKDYKDSEPRFASVMDPNTLAIDFDSGNQPAYQSGGVLTSYPPLDLTGYTARMQLRSNAGSDVVLLELNTTNGGIAINPSTGTISLLITAAQTQAMDFSNAVYDLQLTAADGVTVTRLVEGSISVEPGVTQPVVTP